jgi:hypothetical protein
MMRPKFEQPRPQPPLLQLWGQGRAAIGTGLLKSR